MSEKTFEDYVFTLRSLTEKEQIKKFGEVRITPDVDTRLVYARSKYVLAEKATLEVNEATQWISTDWEDEISPELFHHPYANYLAYSDVHPYEVVEVNTALMMTVREMDAELDPDWKMDMIPGGFVGHVANNRTQEYTYTSNPENKTIKIRYSKAKKIWQDKHGRRFSPSRNAYKFHDYNF